MSQNHSSVLFSEIILALRVSKYEFESLIFLSLHIVCAYVFFYQPHMFLGCPLKV